MVHAQKIKVVLVLCKLEPGGAERMVLELARAFPKESYEVSVVATHGGGLLEREFRASGIATYVVGAEEKILMDGAEAKRLNPEAKLLDPRAVERSLASALSKSFASGLKSFASSVVILVRLVRLLRALRPDIVQTHLFAGDTWGRVATVIAFPGVLIRRMWPRSLDSLRSLGMTTPIVVVTEHNTNFDEGVVKRWIKWALQFVTDRIVAVSEAVREYSARVDGIRSGKMVVIRHGVDVMREIPRQARDDKRGMARDDSVSARDNDRVIIGCIARLEPQKGHQTLLDAFQEVLRPFDSAQGIKDLELWIVGDGALRKELEARARELGIDSRVKFFGARTDVPALLEQMDIVVLPSLWEGAGIALLEAQAAGKPVVASAVGGVLEYVIAESPGMVRQAHHDINGGQTAILVEPGDARALGEALERLIQNPTLRQQMGEAGRKFVAEHFTIERMAGEYEAAYQYCLSEVEGHTFSRLKKFSPSTRLARLAETSRGWAEATAKRASSGNKFLQPTLRDAVVAVTYLCQSRCNMCSIWMNKKLPKLQPEDMRLLPKTLWNINISGGEPFLRPDLPELVAEIKQRVPKAQIIISSNGFATKRILEHMKKILMIDPRIGVAISIDGIGAMHDAVRGIPGGFRMCLETVRGLKNLGMKNIRIAFTAQDMNVKHLPMMHELAQSLGVDFTMSAVHNSSHYFQKEDNAITAVETFQRPYQQLIAAQLRSWKPKQWIRAYYSLALLEFLQTGKRRLQNYNGVRSFFLDPNRRLYPSVASAVSYGELGETRSLDPSSRTNGVHYGAGSARDDVVGLVRSQPEKTEKARTEQHWMICTAREAMRVHWLSVAWWIFTSKLLLHIQMTAPLFKFQILSTKSQTIPNDQNPKTKTSVFGVSRV